MSSTMRLQAFNKHNKLKYWSSVIEACQSSGMSIRRWGEEHNIPKTSYYNWQRKVFKSVCTKPEFVEFCPQPETAEEPMKPEASITVFWMWRIKEFLMRNQQFRGKLKFRSKNS